jgi:hypothetical protein
MKSIASTFLFGLVLFLMLYLPVVLLFGLVAFVIAAVAANAVDRRMRVTSFPGHPLRCRNAP